jgi:hypothetical protein
MNHRLILRRILLACITLFLLLLAWAALAGGVCQIPHSSTAGQQVETFVQLVCGLLTLLTVVTCFWWHHLASPIRVAWACSLVLTAGLSALVWGPPMPHIALLFAAIVLLVSLAVIWALRRLTGGDVNTAEQPEQTEGRFMDDA